MSQTAQGQSFATELSALVNKYSLENHSNTPDFLLAEYMIACFEAYNRAKNESLRLYGDLQVK